MGDLIILRPALNAEYDEHWQEAYDQALVYFAELDVTALRDAREGCSGHPVNLGPGARAYLRGTQAALDKLIELAVMREARHG